MIRLHRLAALLAVALLSACATGPGSDSSFNLRLLDDRESGLAYAVRFASEVPAPGDRAGLFVGIGERYAALEQGEAAASVRAFAGELIVTSAEGSRVSRPAVALARAYIEQGSPSRAATLLEAAVARVPALPTPAARANVLAEIIDISFENGDALFDVLRLAIEAVFVVEDLGRRVDILTDAALRYQQQGSRQSANVLIQQSIPAAGNIDEPWARAAAFAAIAGAYRAIGEEERADRMIADGIEAARGADAAPPAAAARFLSRLIDLGRRLDALDRAEGIERPQTRAVVLSRIAEGYDTEELRSSAFILYARAVSAAGTVPDAAGRAESYLTVAESYLRYGETQLAVIQAQNALRSLGRVNATERGPAVLLRLADLFLAAEVPAELEPVAELAPPAATARVSAYIATRALDAYPDVSVAHLERALAAQAQRSNRDDEAALDIARTAARLGRIDEAIAEVAAMEHARRISEAVTVIGYEAMRAGGLTDAQRVRLEAVYRAYRQRQRLG